MRSLLLVVSLVLLASPARAAPRVAVIDTAKLWKPGGIARWLATAARLETERKKFRLVESPDGKTVAPPPKPDASNKRLRDLQRNLERVKREAREHAAWTRREREVLGPIEADVRRAVVTFAKRRGIDLLLDRDAGEMIVYAAPGVDVTAAFIAEYNRAHPR